MLKLGLRVEQPCVHLGNVALLVGFMPHNLVNGQVFLSVRLLSIR